MLIAARDADVGVTEHLLDNGQGAGLALGGTTRCAGLFSVGNPQLRL